MAMTQVSSTFRSFAAAFTCIVLLLVPGDCADSKTHSTTQSPAPKSLTDVAVSLFENLIQSKSMVAALPASTFVELYLTDLQELKVEVEKVDHKCLENNMKGTAKNLTEAYNTARLGVKAISKEGGSTEEFSAVHVNIMDVKEVYELAYKDVPAACKKHVPDKISETLDKAIAVYSSESK